MDRQEVNCLEEKLREAACIGDLEAIITLIKEGVNPNAQHLINGWTALHWAAKRGQLDIVKYLLEHGADKAALTKKGETPLSLASRPDVRTALGGESSTSAPSESLSITPNYLKYAPLNPKVDLPSKYSHNETTPIHDSTKSFSSMNLDNEELVLKVRIASNVVDNDFIEIELPRREQTYYSLLRICCEELGLATNQVSRIRKLPNTLVRKDKDVQRLKEFQELELIINSSASDSASQFIPSMNGLFASYPSKSKNQPILY
ncbi:unnamed protein product [Bemisia tabaci]|uniref:Ankyrin repeat domain-containing protein 40 n=1 Tax=Bemisia tabaci TaxID=7038 RepID=A0A9P0A6F1_BEMTA|nr:unnamed protein product [Bemisia tabaci]